MRISIRALRYFHDATTLGSIARAANALNVAPSAIASAIDQVEAEFALKLVQRFPAKGIVATAAGTAVLRKIRHVIEEYDTLFHDGAELRSSLSGNLSVGYYAPVAPAFMAAISAPLLNNHPEITLKFVECDNEQAQAGLLAGHFDLIIFVADQISAGISHEPLIDAPPYLLVPAAHHLAKHRSVTFAQIAQEPLILLDLPFTGQYLRNLLDANTDHARISATATTTEMVRSLVGAGLGVSILNMRPRVALSYAGDGLAAVPINCDAPALRLSLGHLGGNQRRLAAAFSEACQGYFASGAADGLVVRGQI